ncbi:fungal-specific transcription factor domain-domain-containing protein [Microdochium bolleyi]|uniref:Fungal-specific transcription factor domain-domain-containing protein n=1 Tax=Microdochium bolleyi TaxID=196109 RepID=A0A136J9D8_9PEZI|nr:fungal-specific transcription factor domain-domain-containing protein [Microdochium bolleyi]
MASFAKESGSTASNPSEWTSSTNSKPSANAQAPTIYRRRQRAAQACETCHTRKVRCDVSTLGLPCTNCAAFRIDCRIAQRNVMFSSATNAGLDSASRRADAIRPAEGTDTAHLQTAKEPPTGLYHMSEQGPMPSLTVEQAQDESIAANMLTDLLNKTQFMVPALEEPGQVTFLGESASVNWLIRDHNHPLHFPMAPGYVQVGAGTKRLDSLEMDILHQRSAFRLPPKDIRDELIAAFFQWVHPIVPAINKREFMEEYEDSSKSTSLFLLQTIMLAGSRVCKHPKVAGNIEAQRQLSRKFYERAKALFNVGYETDRVKMIQGLVLMSWYSQDPAAVNDNAWFWTSVAISVAEGAGMHRNIEGSNLSKSQKRTWKRIWWTLYTRDREVAVTLGRPCIINLDESDVETLTLDDLIGDEEEPANVENWQPRVQVRFFLEYVRLCDIITVILSQQYSLSRHRPRNVGLDLIQSEVALGEWLQDCQLPWLKSEHEPWSALLALHYHTAVCLLHRANLSSSGSGATDLTASDPTTARTLSIHVAYHSANAITYIVEVLQARSELLYCPSFVQYSLLSALTFHGRRVHKPDPMDFSDVGGHIKSCISVLQEIYKAAPANDIIRLWVQPAPNTQASAAVTADSVGRNGSGSRYKNRSHSFHAFSSKEQQRKPPQRVPPSGKQESVSVQRPSNTQKAFGRPSTAIADSSQPSRATLDQTTSVPGVPTGMLSVFGLAPVSPKIPAPAEQQHSMLQRIAQDGTAQHLNTAIPENPVEPQQRPLSQSGESYHYMSSAPEQGLFQHHVPRSPMTWDNQQIYEATGDGGNVLRPGGFEGHRSNTVGFMGTTYGLPGSFTDISMDDWFRYFGVHEEQS